jgi:hypothetical protein
MPVEEVVERLIAAQQHSNEDLKKQGKREVVSGLVLYASPEDDDPIEFYKTAQLAVKHYGKGVIGLAVLGDRM